ncbi:MAG: GTPase Era [Pseudoclavibacter sp.]
MSDEAAASAPGEGDDGADAPDYRAGFVTFVGRPNVGKSTLTNALVGEKIVITSPKPQTTRRAVRGIVHRPNGQLIIIDTPGMHRPRTLLGQRLNDVVQQTLADVDVVAFCVPADEAIGPGDRFIADQLDDAPRAKHVALVTKAETISKEKVGDQLLAVSQLREWDLIVPVSAVGDIQLDTVVRELIALMPVSPQLYPDETVTEETFEARAAELIREAALRDARDELPHSIAVTVDEVVLLEDGASREVYASIIVERDSQKGIVIGRAAERLKGIRQRAQRELTAIAHVPVSLSLHVKVAKEWQRDPKHLGRLGF